MMGLGFTTYITPVSSALFSEIFSPSPNSRRELALSAEITTSFFVTYIWGFFIYTFFLALWEKGFRTARGMGER